MVDNKFVELFSHHNILVNSFNKLFTNEDINNLYTTCREMNEYINNNWMELFTLYIVLSMDEYTKAKHIYYRQHNKIGFPDISRWNLYLIIHHINPRSVNIGFDGAITKFNQMPQYFRYVIRKDMKDYIVDSIYVEAEWNCWGLVNDIELFIKECENYINYPFNYNF